MEFNSQQSAALSAVSNWIQSRSKPFFYLGGFAGTGKSTLAKHLAEGVSGRTHFAAYTGKAAHVMRRKGCPEATTIHSLMYTVSEKSKERLRTLQEEMEKRTREEPEFSGSYDERILLERIRKEKEALKKPTFTLNIDSALQDAALIVVDECSMIDRFLAEDLLSFRVPILALGDPAQLPPIHGAGYFTRGTPDFMLTEIVRQARDNPILQLATMYREGRSPPPGAYGDSLVTSASGFDFGALPPSIQMIVGKNVTRRKANDFMRRKLGFVGESPMPGDRLVCLRNNHELGLLNGSIWRTISASPPEAGKLCLEIESEDGGARLFVEAHEALFKGGEVEYYARRDAQEFDFGYALTAHKAQGSEWPEVLVRDESGCFREERWRWSYTAVTRASEKVTILV